MLRDTFSVDSLLMKIEIFFVFFSLTLEMLESFILEELFLQIDLYMDDDGKYF